MLFVLQNRVLSHIDSVIWMDKICKYQKQKIFTAMYNSLKPVYYRGAILKKFKMLKKIPLIKVI